MMVFVVSILEEKTLQYDAMLCVWLGRMTATRLPSDSAARFFIRDRDFLLPLEYGVGGVSSFAACTIG